MNCRFHVTHANPVVEPFLCSSHGVPEASSAITETGLAAAVGAGIKSEIVDDVNAVKDFFADVVRPQGGRPLRSSLARDMGEGGVALMDKIHAFGLAAAQFQRAVIGAQKAAGRGAAVHGASSASLAHELASLDKAAVELMSAPGVPIVQFAAAASHVAADSNMRTAAVWESVPGHDVIEAVGHGDPFAISKALTAMAVSLLALPVAGRVVAAAKFTTSQFRLMHGCKNIEEIARRSSEFEQAALKFMRPKTPEQMAELRVMVASRTAKGTIDLVRRGGHRFRNASELGEFVDNAKRAIRSDTATSDVVRKLYLNSLESVERTERSRLRQVRGR